MNFLAQLLSEIVVVSIWSISVGLIVGGVIGLVIGLVKKRLKYSLLSAIFGSFVGTLTIAFVPLFSIPGLVNGGAYAGVYVLAMLMLFVPTGAIAGALVYGLAGAQRSQPWSRQVIWLSLAIPYLLLTTGILLRIVIFRAD